MDNDLLYFLQNVSLKEDDSDKKEVTIAIELKEMLNENDKITIVLTYDGNSVNTMHIRRKNDK